MSSVTAALESANKRSRAAATGFLRPKSRTRD
jgi:hypothetical protein